MRRVASFLCCATVALVFMGLPAEAQACFPPARPFVPSDPADARRFADLIRQDFETYLADVQAYFRCLDEERTRVIAEAREVTEEYGRFLEPVSR